jgi:hypothetical protein
MIDSLMTHSVSPNTRNNAARYSHNTVQGHHHSVFEISYYADMQQIRWSMSVGSLLDPHSVAAKYAAGNVLKRGLLGCGVIVSEKTENKIVMSDLHIPYQHKDAFDFLWAVKKEFKCDETFNVGDVIDHHQGSYHESEPDALSPQDEFNKARVQCAELEARFPKMVITQGNHDCIPQRKLKTVGLPAEMINDYNALYRLKGGWSWVKNHKFDSGNGRPVLVPMTLNKRGRWDKKVKAR